MAKYHGDIQTNNRDHAAVVTCCVLHTIPAKTKYVRTMKGKRAESEEVQRSAPSGKHTLRSHALETNGQVKGGKHLCCKDHCERWETSNKEEKKNSTTRGRAVENIRVSHQKVFGAPLTRRVFFFFVCAITAIYRA